jgi:TonB-linked SusC/RagA family outer membrane protein
LPKNQKIPFSGIAANQHTILPNLNLTAMTRIYCLLLYLCPILSYSQSQKPATITGKVVSPENTPLIGATIRFLNSKLSTQSNSNGTFQLKGVLLPDTLEITYTGYLIKKIHIINPAPVVIKMEPSTNTLNEVTVNTGYQSLPKERSTGSFVQIDKELFNRKVSTNILDRLDGVTSGLLFNRNKTAGANESDITIRGRSTLFGQVNPLIVIDNFPYDGDISNINPNEVESITILKDASAASIWGVRSGNGVIVITTKKGKAGQTPKISFNTNITSINRPDLYYQSTADARSYIDFESQLFAKGYYNTRIAIPYYVLAPAVDIFSRRKNNLMSSADSASQIDALAGQDVRTDLNRYFYRPGISQQYALTFSGGTVSNQYFLFAGYDKTLPSQAGTSQDRVNVNVKNTLSIITNKLELNTNIAFTSSGLTKNAAAFNNAYPIYQRLVGDNGKAIPVYNAYRKSWIDTIGQGQLLDWTNRPYDELGYADDHVRLNDYRIAATMKYSISKRLDLTVLYQYQNGRSQEYNYEGQDTYYTRDYINRFSQPDYLIKTAVRPVPLGTILESSTTNYASNNARAVVSYSGKVSKNGQLNLLAGTEVKDYKSFTSNRRQFGYNRDNATEVAVSLTTQYPTIATGSQSFIGAPGNQNGTTDRYLSYFTNAGFTYHNRYLINASARRDESNLFGVNANQKGVPLWSTGIGWIVSTENWFHSKVVSYLKLRLTYGYNGNVDKSSSAYTTGQSGVTSIFLQPAINIINPPNPDLSWEKSRIINFGADYSLFNGKVQGTAEAYYRKGTNLTGLSSVATQTGVSQFRQNIADFSGKGIDLSLSATPIHSDLIWNINFLYSYNTDRIDRYLLAPSGIKRYITNISSNPYEGKSWSSLFAYKWNGLNPTTGDPQGFVAGATSVDYAKLTTPTSVDDIQYMGPGRPTHFGSLRNSFSYKRFSLSFNISYELGYYFRRNSVNYSNIITASSTYGDLNLVSGDLAKRWQNPGDELITNIPSFTYPANSARDEFYTYSSLLVEKGDHVRLRDLQFSYDLNLGSIKTSPVKNAKIYLYANNIGILWRANQYGIDPNAVTGMPAPFSLSAGINIDFK